MEQEQYLSERLEDQINWYNNKSQSNQKWFKSLRVAEMVCAAIIPFIAGMIDSVPYGQFFVGFLGVIIAVAAGLSALNKYQENWITYRTTSETLKHEKFLFLTNAKPYDEEDAFQQFVQRVEGLISKENSKWARDIKKKHT